MQKTLHAATREGSVAKQKRSTKSAGVALKRRARTVERLLAITRAHLEEAACLSEAEYQVVLHDVDRAIENCDSLLRALRTAGARTPVAGRVCRSRRKKSPPPRSR